MIADWDLLKQFADQRDQEQNIAEELKAKGIEVLSARESRFSMEDVFISIVAQAQHIRR